MCACTLLQVAILKLLLTHDPTLRPTADQLLASELLPPPHMEEAELTEVLRSTLSQPDTKAYRHMISAIFGQRVDPATDFTYDIDLHKVSNYREGLEPETKLLTEPLKTFLHKQITFFTENYIVGLEKYW